MGVKVKRWKGAWYVFVWHHGKRKAKRFTSRSAALRVAQDVQAKLALGDTAFMKRESRTPPVPTFSIYSDSWRNQHEMKPSTAAFYGQFLRLYVRPTFGENRIDEITRQKAKSWVSGLTARKLAKNTIRLAIATLRAVLNAAIEDGYITLNPARGLGKFVRAEKPEREATALKDTEVERLLETAKNQLEPVHYALILTALRSGLREGEIAGLRWGDLQFGDSETKSDRFILVQRTYDRRWSHKMLTPKSKKPRRVDMSRELRRVSSNFGTKRLVKAFGEGKSDIAEELVFPSEAGTPMEMNNFSERVLKPLLAQAGLRKIRFHDLRHTYGSLLIKKTRDLVYVRDQMGHSSIKVTADIYGHLVPGGNVAFEDCLDQKPSTQPDATYTQPEGVSDAEVSTVKLFRSNGWEAGIRTPIRRSRVNVPLF
jgi:integrase